jgi:hypothetical protein
VRYLRGGATPNRWFAVEWNRVRSDCCDDAAEEYTFEAILHESGDIVFQYGTMTHDDSYYCQASGIEDATGLDGLEMTSFCNQVAPNHAVRTTRPAPAPAIARAAASVDAIIGRDADVRTLAEAIARVAQSTRAEVILVRGEPFRGKYRTSFETPVPFTPGEPDEIRFDLPDVAHTYRKGHRIVVHVQSSWLPLVDRNPQTFTDIPNAKPEHFVKATQRVYRQAGKASHVTLRIAR